MSTPEGPPGEATDDEVTVVVPVHGDPAILLPLLRALADQAAALGVSPRVLVSDDGSDVPISTLLDTAPFDALRVEVVRSDRNRGPGGARNNALGSVRSPWVAFLDADTVPLDGWLERLLRLVGQPDTADFVEGRLLIPDSDRATPFTHATEAEPPAQRVAANMFFRTEVLRSVGGFDERFYDPSRHLHFREDADLAFRLEDAGASIGYDPDLVVAHPPLPSSFWVPLRLARRYHFDPLLDRLHPSAFRTMNAHRKLGPVSLRRARHDAATGLVLAVVAVVVGAAGKRRSVVRVGAAATIGAWAANAAALCWRRELRPKQLPAVLLAAFLVPWVYVWHYWRGVLKFRHRPRL